MKPTVYIETTIPSFYCEIREDAASRHMRDTTRRWWSERAPDFVLVTSNYTLMELAQAPEFIRSGAERLMRDVAVIDVPDRFEEVVATYLAHRLMPAAWQGDAAHLAVAALYGCDYLLTWNYRHLANARKTRHIDAVNRLVGLVGPLIVTPESLMEADT